MVDMGIMPPIRSMAAIKAGLVVIGVGGLMLLINLLLSNDRNVNILGIVLLILGFSTLFYRGLDIYS